MSSQQVDYIQDEISDDEFDEMEQVRKINEFLLTLDQNNYEDDEDDDEDDEDEDEDDEDDDEDDEALQTHAH